MITQLTLQQLQFVNQATGYAAAIATTVLIIWAVYQLILTVLNKREGV